MNKTSTKTAENRLLYTRTHLLNLGVNLSNSTMLRLEALGKFPKRIRLGDHSVAWVAAEIREHIDALAEQRGAK